MVQRHGTRMLSIALSMAWAQPAQLSCIFCYCAAGSPAVLRNIFTEKINNEGFKLSAENKSTERLPGGQMDGTKKTGGELLSYKQQIPKS